MAPGTGRHDDGEFDYSQNDELRMCGMAGDDEDDDVHEDAAMLFDRSATDPLLVDDFDPPVDMADADGGQSEAATASSNSSELASYLDCDTISQLDDEFDIMQWWHEHKLTYSVLSVLAKDILIVPMSTISSESTFSLTGRIIEERRWRLNPETVDALTCIKDWEKAEP
ncbi:unnamed protein product [Miscanthus lutarioriparius]|uniref:HAT C-terminal dimerisation domain-containing protein n=1 Tax=Miscanthus lutarioriparius TaxID=422564 RepID=A0A811R419_9POAL|nr:unnamed protein product [Miscanthus lutarioriparius]